MDNENTQPKGPNVRGAALRALAVLAFIAVLGVGMWGAIKLARSVPNSLASVFVGLTSIFVPANETITLSAPSGTVQAGVPFSLSWTHNKKSVEGSYTFRYDCAEGVYFTSLAPSGAQENVYCNVPFNFLNNSNSISLTPISNQNRYIDVTVYIDFTPNGSSKSTVTGKTSLTIENNGFGTSPSTVGTTTPSYTPTTTPATTSTTPPPTTTHTTPTPTTHPVTPGQPSSHTYPVGGNGGQVSNPNGYVDLAATVFQFGVVDKTTGVFTASSTPSRSSSQYRVAVRFAIQNNGTKTSPQFDFSAVLPTLPSYIFNSPMQQELAPGDRIEFTLGFDSIDTNGNNTFTVNVDPSSRINEPNKSNNIVHYTVVTYP